MLKAKFHFMPNDFYGQNFFYAGNKTLQPIKTQKKNAKLFRLQFGKNQNATLAKKILHANQSIRALRSTIKKMS
jgi:hypothetical protein